MIRFILRTLLVLLVPLSAAFAAPLQVVGFDHSSWDSLLKKHVIYVREGQATQVDYAGFKADRGALEHYLASTSAIARPEFDKWSKSAQLAFLINAYNAWTVALVLTRYPDVASIKDLGSFLQSPWKKSFIPLLGDTRSLDDVEHGLIRGSGRYNDPRIHFALNCASIGCPALRPEAYTAERLNAQLEDATQQFLSDRTRNRFDKNTLKVSSIFKWYREDFEKGWRGANSVGQFLTIYRQPLGLDLEVANRLSAGEIAIDFLDYNWHLNAITEPRQSRKP
ncbi:DUF547 domain-containing protein [Glaciimonas immobilis]|uniref:DUF547 domain-containing protein n=1 Tax=Glaciimonas immobilis TaxID=728004 RepID=A0A840RW57_9BURK|nr:DUF547 domain-containing protein [Glaciimonas immobilis]KAF3996529.1 DUF547 domain-containing protein [Glaciimonas immobilis]MBB5201106.1 hypothetical protein [Glaciimonas immobilis]